MTDEAVYLKSPSVLGRTHTHTHTKKPKLWKTSLHSKMKTY